MIYLSNAFSLTMIPQGGGVVEVKDLETKKVSRILADEFTSAIGHQDTANVVSSLLGIKIPVNRINVSLTSKDTLIVAQYIGPRLAEGTTVLPDGARVEFKHILIRNWKEQSDKEQKDWDWARSNCLT